jgi:hypothetical protein
MEAKPPTGFLIVAQATTKRKQTFEVVEKPCLLKISIS